MAKDFLFLYLKQFLESRILPGKPLLLGYSGGPDSKALLHLLLQCKRLISFELHLVHIDHGWRIESPLEAASLQAQAHDLGLIFHLKTLTRESFQEGNWEKQGRDKRLRFFSQIYGEIGAQALILGHHADDWAEGVLKRLFEGASLPFLGGLTRESELQGMKVYRPLLSFPKQRILEWLSERKISYFSDPTNQSSQFLRGRMRLEMLPLLTQSFGKEVSANLCRLGEEAQELKAYFHQLNQPLLDRIDETGILDLTSALPLPFIQLKYLLKAWIQRENVFLSHQMVHAAVDALLQSTTTQICSGRGGLDIKKGAVRIIKRDRKQD